MRMADEKIYSYIGGLIDNELERDDADMEFIEKMNGILDTLDKGAAAPDSSIKRKKLKELRRECERRYAFKKPRCRIAVVAAIAAIAVLVSAFAGVAVSNYDPASILRLMKERFYKPMDGDTIEVDGTTYTYTPSRIRYKTVEECMEAEGVPLRYPSWLPDGITLSELCVVIMPDDREIVYEFSKTYRESGILLAANLLYDESEYMNDESYEQAGIGDMRIYFNLECSSFEEYAVVFSDDVGYRIIAPDRETVESIAKGLKK